MGSGVMIYTPSFMKIGSGIQKVMGRMHRHTDSKLNLLSLLLFLACFPYFEEIKGRIMRLPCYLYIPLINFRIPEPVFMEPQGTSVHLNCVLQKYLPSVFVSIYVSPSVTRKVLGKNFTAATNTHATIDELLDASFSMRFLCRVKESMLLVLPRTSCSKIRGVG
jgi:hypothetical protein